MGGQVLITSATYERVKDVVEIRDVLKVDVKGARRPMTLYDVKGVAGEYNIFLPETADSAPSELDRKIPVTIRQIRENAILKTLSDAWITHLSERTAGRCLP